MPYLISVQKTKKYSVKHQLLLCLTGFLLCCCSPTESLAQKVYGQSFPFTFEYKYKKNKTRIREGKVSLTVQYGKRGSGFGFVETPGQIIDFSDVKEKIIQVQILKLELDRKGKDNALDHPLVVDTKRTGVGAGIQQLKLKKATIFEFLEDSSPSKSRLEFDVVDNGTVSLVIPFGMIAEDVPFERWTFDNGEIRILFKVEGIVKEIVEPERDGPEPDIDLESWEANKGNINGWLAYIGEFPSGKYLGDAIQRIESFDQQNWSNAQREETLAGYQNYVRLANTYPQYAKYLSAAEEEIQAIEVADAAAQEERAAWKVAQKENTQAAYYVYLDDYPDGRYKRKAKENIQLLIPMELVVRDLGNGKSRLTIKNAINPRYKNVSLDYGLQIDDSRLRRDSVLQVSYLTGGRYKIVVADELGKRDSVTFDNKLVADMWINQRDSSTMIFSIKKGIKPYRIDLIHATANTLAWSQDSIFSEKVEIPIASWQEAQLGGEFKVEVWDSKSWKPVQMVPSLYIPEVAQALEIPFIIAGVLGIIVFLTGIFFLVKMFLDQRNKNTHY